VAPVGPTGPVTPLDSTHCTPLVFAVTGPLLANFGSLVPLLTLAAFAGMLVAVAESTPTIATFADCPAARLGIAQLIAVAPVPVGTSVQVPETPGPLGTCAVTFVTEAGMVSLTTTPAAPSGPLFVTVICQATSPPGETTGVVITFAIARSVDGGFWVTRTFAICGPHPFEVATVVKVIVGLACVVTKV